MEDFQGLYKIIEAAGGVVFNEKNEILMIYRLKTWDLPKGKIEKGETPADAAFREVCEETNNSLFCTDDEDCAYKVRNIIEHRSSEMFYDAKCKYLLFYCRVDASLLAAPLSRFGEAEGAKKHEYKWVTSAPQPLHFRLRGFRFKQRF